MNLNHPEMAAAAEEAAAGTVTKMFINEGLSSTVQTRETSTVLDRTVERLVDDRQVRFSCVQLAINCRDTYGPKDVVEVLSDAGEIYDWVTQGEPSLNHE